MLFQNFSSQMWIIVSLLYWLFLIDKQFFYSFKFYLDIFTFPLIITILYFHKLLNNYLKWLCQDLIYNTSTLYQGHLILNQEKNMDNSSSIILLRVNVKNISIRQNIISINSITNRLLVFSLQTTLKHILIELEQAICSLQVQDSFLMGLI